MISRVEGSWRVYLWLPSVGLTGMRAELSPHFRAIPRRSQACFVARNEAECLQILLGGDFLAVRDCPAVRPLPTNHQPASLNLLFKHYA